MYSGYGVRTYYQSIPASDPPLVVDPGVGRRFVESWGLLCDETHVVELGVRRYHVSRSTDLLCHENS